MFLACDVACHVMKHVTRQPLWCVKVHALLLNRFTSTVMLLFIVTCMHLAADFCTSYYHLIVMCLQYLFAWWIVFSNGQVLELYVFGCSCVNDIYQVVWISGYEVLLIKKKYRYVRRYWSCLEGWSFPELFSTQIEPKCQSQNYW
jgi:hypothetical protein